MLTKRKKQNAINEGKRHEGDTGSPEVQVALLSKQIDALTSHLKTHKKDIHSRRGLLQMVSNRRKHLKYLEQNNKRAFASITKKLGLTK